MNCNHAHTLFDTNGEFEKEWSVEEIAATQELADGEGFLDGSDGHGNGDGEAVFHTHSVTLNPVVIPKRSVSGRYRGTSGTSQLELRIDVDGKRPTKRISGDTYQVAGAVVRYFGSFVVNSATITITPSEVIIKGVGSFSFATAFPMVTVTLKRVPLVTPTPPAKIVFSDSAGAIGSTYLCQFESPYFRTVQFEQDAVIGTNPFSSYNTGSLPSGGSARTLSVVSAFAEAGIEMQPSGISNTFSNVGAGGNARWSDSELHASMQAQFSLWRNDPQWKVWLLVAPMHEEGSSLRGIMFDQQGRQRQGCAVFDEVIGGTSAESQRGQLRTYVHELGHCFNLLHSWQKSFATPPMPNRVDALSWMNYVQNFPGGAGAYWAAFPFQFDDPEIVHLRHAFRNNVIMGGANFGIGAADFDTQPFGATIVDNSGLRLELDALRSVALGQPVEVEIKLYTTDLRGKRVHTHLHPKYGFVQVAIRKPGGDMVAYRPLMETCIETETVMLDETKPSIYESAYIGYGRSGFHFDQVGFYQIYAIYHALDGSEVVSEPLTLRVRGPLDQAEEEIADLYFGEDQGKLFYMLGSDSEFLRGGNDALDLVLDKYGDHPLSVYARLVKGINAERRFKTVTAEKELTVREPDTTQAIDMLSDVVSLTRRDEEVSNITLNMTMRRLARAHRRRGDENRANATLHDMVQTFAAKGLKPHVIATIKAEADAARSEEV